MSSLFFCNWWKSIKSSQLMFNIYLVNASFRVSHWNDNIINLCLCFLRWLPPGIYTPQRHTVPWFRWCNLFFPWTSVISLLITEITIKIEGHSGVTFFFLVSKVQPNWKLHSVRGLQNLNGKFHQVNFIKLNSSISEIYTGKNIIWKFFVESDFI